MPVRQGGGHVHAPLKALGGGVTRTQLKPRERRVATVAALVAMYRLEQLPFHFKRALDNGLCVDELAEVITHLAFYSGWPAAASARNFLSELQACLPIRQEKSLMPFA